MDAGAVARGYADKFPCIVNGGKTPNQAEYDLDLPLTADYSVWALYTAAQPRPVDIYLDGKKLVRGFTQVTGSWQTSRARWFKQCTARITKGRHTVKLLCPGACIPHICALRFESSQPFPRDWRLGRRRPVKEQRGPASFTPWQEGYVGFYPMEPPDTYDYKQPYIPIPLPTPRAHRALEMALLPSVNARLKVELVRLGEPAGDASRNELAQVAPGQEDADASWAAIVSVAPPGGRALREQLPLAPARLRKMLDHIARLIARFRQMEGVAPDYLEGGRQAARALGKKVEEALAEPEGEERWRRFFDLYLQAFKLKSRVALSNPLLGFGRLVFAKRLTYNTSHIYTTYYDGSGRYKAGSGIYVLSPPRPDGKLTCLTTELKTDGIYRDPDVSWDGRRVLFSYKSDPRTAYHVFEVGADGSGLRQVTNTIYDDVDPCYLPDGRIAFISTRTERVTLCHNAFTVSNLFVMNPDGSGARCISANTIHDFTPSVCADGALLVSQWRYVDKHVGNNQSLWRMNPDGTHPMHVAGAHFGPVTYWGARQVPGSSWIACILGPHMPYAVGPVALVNPMFTQSSPQVYLNLTPEIAPPTHRIWHRPEAGYHADVFPLSEDFFIVSYCYGPDPRDPTGYGIYLLDRWNNRDLICRDPQLSSFEAFSLRPRPTSPAVAMQTPGVEVEHDRLYGHQADWGTFYCLDVYRGLTGIKRGEVRYLRVIEEIPKPVSSRTRGYGLQNPAVSYRGHFALKRLWGTVPVEADGSACFVAPANRAIYFSALDENFMEIQRMRTFTTVAPGERVGCLGCHEPKHTAPPSLVPLALKRPPSTITPPPCGGVHAPDFFYDVQPVLDRHCVRCHRRPKPKGNLDLSPDYTPLFNLAYEVLSSRRLVNYVDIHQVSTLVTRPPEYYGSHASKLIEALRTTHKDRVKLPPGDFRRLVTWIDCNAPYYGTYIYTRPGTTGGRDIFAARGKQLAAIHKRRCASCHGGSALPTLLRMRIPPDASRALRAPLAKAAGGDQTCGKPVFASTDDPDYRRILAIYSEIAANPRVDMLKDRPPVAESKCRYIYRPGIVREARR